MRKRSLGAILIVLSLAALTGCASVPLKQRATQALSLSETALGASQDAERLACAPAADQSKPIPACNGPFSPAPLSNVVHLQLAALYVKAFDAQGKAAAALLAWRAGDPAPANLAAYQSVINDIDSQVQKLFPSTSPVVTKIQDAVAQAAAVAKALGVQ